jgi:predicted homoserine dehydrogenase-like protein
MTPREPAPIRIIQVGAGAMGRAWLQTLAESREVDLVGLVDVDVHAREPRPGTTFVPSCRAGRRCTRRSGRSALARLAA